MKLIYPACFYPCEEKVGAYSVCVPDLPGCVTEGDDLSSAVTMAVDAASGWILDALESGEAVPQASDIKAVKPEEGGFVSLIMLDIDAYAEKYGVDSVCKNLMIPAWLNTLAENQRVDFSQVLQEALKLRLDIGK